MIKILLIEDDPEITALLTAFLKECSMEVLGYENPLRALETFDIESYALILLDLTLPKMDGLEVCKCIRTKTDIPIIISSARNDLTDKIIALEYGADDYLPKPYEPRELVARIQSHIRRYQGTLSKPLSRFVVDSEAMQITKDGITLDLTLAEYELLALMIKHSHKAVSRTFIANNVNAIAWKSSDRSIDVLIGRLRQKVEENHKSPVFIRTIRGVGYKFTD